MAPSTTGRLQPGDPAPNPQVQGPAGAVSLSTAWAEGPVVLTFLRHFG
jgi:hypothetical protein